MSDLSEQEREQFAHAVQKLLPWAKDPILRERYDVATQSILLQIAHNQFELPREWTTQQRLDFLCAEIAPLVQKMALLCLEPAGAAVGMESATGMGRVSTQMSLNTFHSSGQVHSEMLHGVPRINELINATPNPKHSSMVIRLLPHRSWMRHVPDDPVEAFHVFKHWTRFWFEHRTLGDFLDMGGRQRLLYQPTVFEGLPSPQPYWYEAWRSVYGPFRAETMPTAEDQAVWYTLRLQFDRAMLVRYQLSLQYIAQTIQEVVLWAKIKKRFGGWTPMVHSIASPDFEATIDVHVRVDNLPQLDRIFRVARIQGSRQGQILSDPQRRMRLFVEKVVYPAFSRFRLTGVPGLEEINWRKRSGKKPEARKTDAAPHWNWEVMTRGSALREVLVMPQVESETVFTNHAFQVVEVLGIEAARALYISEMRESMGTVDEALFHTNVDSMMSRGTITPANRHGIQDVGPLVQASNEMSTQTLLKAASSHKVESLAGVSAATMLGQHIRSGTGLHDVLWDEEAWFQRVAEVEQKEREEQQRAAEAAAEKTAASVAHETAPAAAGAKTTMDQLLSRLSLTTGHAYQMQDMEEV